MRICFDMDGTIANLYGVDGWLADLLAENTRPYEIAEVMVRMNTLARLLNRLQKKGYEIGIISWLSKSGSDKYNAEVTEVKKAWLRKHLASVRFDFVEIVKYGTDKNIVWTGASDILFDDEIGNRENWNGTAYDVDKILEVLRAL